LSVRVLGLDDEKRWEQEQIGKHNLLPGEGRASEEFRISLALAILMDAILPLARTKIPVPN
jgi:hypothetical protein